MKARYIIFPGRHLAMTCTQSELFHTILSGESLDLQGKRINVAEDALIIACITGFDQSGTRRNPFEGWLRALMLQDWAAQEGLPLVCVPVPDTGRTDRFASYVLEHIHQIFGPETAAPLESIVACSTPAVIRSWISEGYKIQPLEMTKKEWPQDLADVLSDKEPIRPWDVVERLIEESPQEIKALHPSSAKLMKEYKMVEKLRRIFGDHLLSDHGTLTQGRDYNVYARAFDDGAKRKWDELSAYVKPGVIVDLGCGPASLLKEASFDPRLHESDLHGVEISRPLFAEAQHRRSQGAFANPHLYLHHANVLEDGLFEPKSIHTTMTVSLTHEIRSYGSPDELRHLMKNIHQWTVPAGVWLNLDLCGPEKPDQMVVMDFCDPKTLNLFECFANEWAFGPVAYEKHPGNRILMDMRAAHEFLLHKDYPDNWESEMKEEFGEWNWDTWKKEIQNAGWSLEPSSKSYTNEWLVKNRFEPHLRLLDPVSGANVAWPATHCLIVARA